MAGALSVVAISLKCLGEQGVWMAWYILANHLRLWYVSLSLTATVTAAQRTVTRSNMAISPFCSAWFAA